MLFHTAIIIKNGVTELLKLNHEEDFDLSHMLLIIHDTNIYIT